ncbi:hypothetical protein MOV08_36950 [Streptomyces yunnanensis]|uniref:Uncharacterized protein n=1 Tax=Streptomyces yunnanensis TaxID=156453 RepID=A0ABY8AH59_9ACTN|nr:hypothetical protein [Streptomyces yunnanensis]WEB44333.1 hypothetical protein MOV08_36950 [Streptomyces yunnanensis]
MTHARGLPDGWRREPRTFARCTKDNANPLPLQDLVMREADDVADTPQARAVQGLPLL